MVTALERRDNPSIPGGLLDVPLLYAGGMGYTETHDLTKSFTHTITLDQFGDGTEGTFALDVTGETHSRDEVSGSGGSVTSATGTLTTDVTYHIVIAGQYADGAFTVTSESYTETGSATSAYSITTSDPRGYTVVTDGDRTDTWTFSWAGTVTDGTLSFDSFSYVASSETNQHWWTDSPMVIPHETRTVSGWEVDETGSGSEASYTGREWSEYYDDVDGDSSDDHPVSGTVDLDPTPLTYEMTWNAAEPTAVNYNWSGETEISGSLTETATYREDRLDVDSFGSDSNYQDVSHLIEDEPDVTDGGGQENAHLDDTMTYTTETTGSGSYVDGSADADYQTVAVSVLAAHDTYTVSGDESTGEDEDGEPYDLVFNYSSDQTTNGVFSTAFEYHDGDDGIHLVNSHYSYTLGSTTDDHLWGAVNGVGFNESSTSTDGGSASFSIPGDNVPITDPAGLRDAYPFVQQDSSVFLVNFGDEPPPSPGVELLKAAVGHAPQEWYNHKIKEIGENAKKKVGRLIGNDWVLIEMGLIEQNGGTAKMTDTFTYPGKGGTFAQAVGRWSEFKDKEKAALNHGKGYHGWSNVTVTSDVKITYYVQPRPAPGQNRSGKCVVVYTLNFKVSGTDKLGRPQTENWNVLNGDFWFEDDNLKTRKLVGDP